MRLCLAGGHLKLLTKCDKFILCFIIKQQHFIAKSMYEITYTSIAVPQFDVRLNKRPIQVNNKFPKGIPHGKIFIRLAENLASQTAITFELTGGLDSAIRVSF